MKVTQKQLLPKCSLMDIFVCLCNMQIWSHLVIKVLFETEESKRLLASKGDTVVGVYDETPKQDKTRQALLLE